MIPKSRIEQRKQEEKFKNTCIVNAIEHYLEQTDLDPPEAAILKAELKWRKQFI